MRLCKGCIQYLPWSCFGVHKAGRDGLRSRCRDCRAVEAKERNSKPEVIAQTKLNKVAWRAKNKDHHAAYNRQWNAANPKRLSVTSAKWKLSNPEMVIANSKSYNTRFRDKRTALQNARHASQLQRTPSWVDLAKVRVWYSLARLLGLQVDHVIPLQGELVSGLHVHNNLQLLSARDNQSKRNRFTP